MTAYDKKCQWGPGGCDLGYFSSEMVSASASLSQPRGAGPVTRDLDDRGIIESS